LACHDRRGLRQIFKNEINRLQPLPEKRKKQRRKRSILKWSLLLILYFYILSYIIYFWIYMCLHGKVLLGGEVKKRR
jgi:cell division septal protein FtsQ